LDYISGIISFLNEPKLKQSFTRILLI
jgi:hypothetical protein